MAKAYIGLDVHKEVIAIGIASAGKDEAVSYGKCSSDIEWLLTALRRLLKKYELTKKDVRV